ncbi:phage terminase small subunit P27 family [Mycobacterium sp.]|uniref:phage terminase small subunit P27 family n=1 Tax=Mycobacterium sp. TaxID=1785 RepID=UPI0031E34EAD
MAGTGSGPKGRPNHLKALEGVREGRINHEEPIPAPNPIVPPVELASDAQAVWDRLAPDLIDKRILTSWDVGLFAAYCNAEARYFAAEAQVNDAGAAEDQKFHPQTITSAFRVRQACLGEMRSIGSSFGLTPADRAQLKVNDNGGSRSGAARLLS